MRGEGKVQRIRAAGIPDGFVKGIIAVGVGVVAGCRGHVGAVKALQGSNVVHHEGVRVDALRAEGYRAVCPGKHGHERLVFGVRHHRVGMKVFAFRQD
ncbi:hypothetical protein D3C78_1672610 [compost metagenome]